MQRDNYLTKATLFVAMMTVLGIALACGGGNHVPTYAYVEVQQGSGSSVAQFQVSSNGTVQPLNPPTVAAGKYIVGLAVVHGGNSLLALSANGDIAGTSSFLQYPINRDGTLAPIPVLSAGPINATYPFTLTPDGRFAVVPSGNIVSSYSISPSGKLTLVNTVAAGNDPCVVAIDPTGQFVYVANFTDDTISEYKLSSTGALIPNGTISSAPTSVYFLQFSPEGFLYSSGCCQLQAVTEYSVDAGTGNLIQLNTFRSGSGQSSEPWSFGFDPTGSYAYSANTASTIPGYTISSFLVNSQTGSLTGNGSDTPGAGDYEVAVDPSGKVVLAVSRSTISQFKVSASGTLVANGTTSLPGTLPDQTAGVVAFAQK